MDKQLFRQKSIDKISSPEQMHDYLRVTSPRLWMVLSAILVLLVGFIVYASTASMENTLDVKVELTTVDTTAEDGTPEQVSYAYAIIPETMRNTVKADMEIRFAEETGRVNTVFSDKQDTLVLIELDKPKLSIPDGTYDGTIVLESTTPISFLLN